jgi:hypothetical protein
MVALAGVTAAVLSVVDLVPYLRDIFRGTTRPHRGTWLIWSVLGLTAFASQFADGATWSLGLVGMQAATTTLVLLLAIRFGVGGASRADLCLIGLAGLGLVGWAVSSAPAVATLFVVAADMIGVAMMLPKTWRDPWSETAPTYVLASGSGLCGALAVGELDASLLLYPSYYAFANGVIAAVILRRRRAMQPAHAETGGSL